MLSASPKVLGSGEMDHSISFLVSKDVDKVHFDFNVIQLLAGRQAASGVDHDTGFALSSSLPFTHRSSWVAESYGYTLLNQNSPAFASIMIGFVYEVHPRLYLDTGLDQGVTHDAPHQRVYVGITAALANLYSFTRSR